MDKKHCIGCEDNFYNGNNSLGVNKCWGLSTAKIILRKKVHINDCPPWLQSPTKYPSCYKQKGYVFFNGDKINWETTRPPKRKKKSNESIVSI